jgi:hypothetical protein
MARRGVAGCVMGVRIPAAVITSVFRSAADITADYSDVRHGSKAEVELACADFRCTPQSRHPTSGRVVS